MSPQLSSQHFHPSRAFTDVSLFLRFSKVTNNQLQCLLQTSEYEFTRLSINIGDTILLDLGPLICPQCHRHVQKLNHGTCASCRDPSSPFQIRMACLFQQPTSYLVLHDGCDPQAPPCEIKDNTRYCHSEHILYLGMMNSLLKVGISRSSRQGGWKQRLWEQGFTEAIVVKSFSSRIDALREEDWWIGMGFPDRLHLDQKVKDLTRPPNQSLGILFPEHLLVERYPEKEVQYLTLYPPLQLPHPVLKPLPATGCLSHLRGAFFILDDYQVIDIRSLHNRSVRRFQVNGEDIV